MSTPPVGNARTPHRTPLDAAVPGPRVALSCVGLGDVLRGSEQHFLDLFTHLKGRVPLVLYQGGHGGPGTRLPRIPRSSLLLRPLTPSGRLAVELWSFTPSLLLELRTGRFDVVNLADIRMAKVRKYLPRRLLPTKFLFTNGSEAPPWIEAAFDFVHCTTPMAHQAALDYGLSAERVFMIPHGVDLGRFVPADPETKARLRARYGIPPDAFVVASVGLLTPQSHKRPAWVIQEAAAAGPGIFLFLAGEHDETTGVVRQLAAEKLGSSAILTRLPAGEQVQAYQLADLFVLGSLREAFGIVVVEAMACGLPVIVHGSPSLRWIAGDGGSTIDMAVPGQLAGEIAFYRDNPQTVRERGRLARRRAEEAFSWDALSSAYAGMFAKCIELPRRADP